MHNSNKSFKYGLIFLDNNFILINTQQSIKKPPNNWKV